MPGKGHGNKAAGDGDFQNKNSKGYTGDRPMAKGGSNGYRKGGGCGCAGAGYGGNVPKGGGKY